MLNKTNLHIGCETYHFRFAHTVNKTNGALWNSAFVLSTTYLQENETHSEISKGAASVAVAQANEGAEASRGVGKGVARGTIIHNAFQHMA